MVFFRGDDFTISSSLLGEWRYFFDIESMYIYKLVYDVAR